jgi:hypothetical protein
MSHFAVIVFAMFLASCATPTANTPPPAFETVAAEQPKPKPSCVEQVRDIMKREADIKFGDSIADNVAEQNDLENWRIVVTDDCLVLRSTDGHILMRDGALYDAFGGSPVLTSRRAKERLARVFACRMAHLQSVAIGVPDCSK